MEQSTVRLGVFLAVLVTMMAWEFIAPRRPLEYSRPWRWGNNLGLVVLNTLLVRLILPLGAVGVAEIAQREGWGFLNLVALPLWGKVALAVLLLDLAIYLQHVAFHALPLLWRLHRMHHADQDFDVTTGLRFHPLEILLSMLIKMALAAALGAPPMAVVLFEVVLNATAMFNHGNVKFSLGFDRALRLLVVTPDMHRVHHSVLQKETDSNFGFNLPWWDRLFGTYRPQPEAGHDAMRIGLEQFRSHKEQALHNMLMQPLRALEKE